MEDAAFILLHHVGIWAIVFLVVLNGHLRHRKKLHIDVVLGSLWLNLIVIGMIVFEWGAGISMFVLSLLYALLSKPMAGSSGTAYPGSFYPVLRPLEFAENGCVRRQIAGASSRNRAPDHSHSPKAEHHQGFIKE